MSQPLSPTGQSERIQLLDVLRGVALLGILVTNIQHFSMFAGAVRNPTFYGDLQGANFWVYAGTFTFVYQKFMPLFSMLFGAGILLAADRRQEAGHNPAAFHYRRMGALFLIAMAHAYLVWYGDILFVYAVCGSVAFLFRHRPARFLIWAGVAFMAGQWMMAAISAAVPGLFGFIHTFQGMSLEEILAADLEAFRGGWMENFRMRALYSLEGQTIGFLLHGFWRTTGMILLGMGLFRLRIITGEASRPLYWAFIAVGVGVGLPITVFSLWMSYSTGWGDFWVQRFSMEVIHWIGIVVSLGWMGIVMLLCRSGCRSWPGRALAAVGRTALSNYLLQSLICTYLFYGFGLGLYGSVERIGQAGIVVSIWALQLLVSPLWLRYFRFGPAEWVWRTLSYGKMQPFRA